MDEAIVICCSLNSLQNEIGFSGLRWNALKWMECFFRSGRGDFRYACSFEGKSKLFFGFHGICM